MVGFREPMHLCTCVSKEGGDGQTEGTEVSLSLSCHTHLDTSVSRSFQRLSGRVTRTDTPVYMRE
jgi:hypothetical protein